MPFHEFNFDGLIGPTHNYAGLSRGNLASQQHRQKVSHPKAAALQGLAKMKFLADLGVRQAVLPPHERPDMATLRRLGFSGSDAHVLERAHNEAPALLAACCSASAMWAANAATVSPSADTADGKVHITPANLANQFHRSLEAPFTARIFRAIFPDDRHFMHHPPLPAHAKLGDEGAANHTRLCPSHGDRGLEIFVDGRDGFTADENQPTKFPARQTRAASAAIARLHALDTARTLFVRQNPVAIDAGAFHNDVVAVGNENVLLYHALAFADGSGSREKIRSAYSALNAREPILIEVSADEVPLADAVASYLFNSQLVTTPTGMTLVCPMECREITSGRVFLEELITRDTPIKAVHFIDVRQSMNNGGGPACLRLRIVLNEHEQAAMNQAVELTPSLYERLVNWVNRHYRDEIRPHDLADVKLLDESRAALDELTRMLGLGSLYPFQMTRYNIDVARASNVDQRFWFLLPGTPGRRLG